MIPSDLANRDVIDIKILWHWIKNIISQMRNYAEIVARSFNINQKDSKNNSSEKNKVISKNFKKIFLFNRKKIMSLII